MPAAVVEAPTAVAPAMIVPSAISMWPAIIAAPPILQLRPMVVLPAIPAQPAIAVWAPMRQLCPIWIWLSSLTSSSITVSPIAPRSIVVLAPISTSAPMIVRPSWGTLTQRPSCSAMPKPSAPITAPACKMVRAPIDERA